MGSRALITSASPEWVPLSVIYHYVLAQYPAPEAAKIAISEARANGQLRLRAEVLEYEARPDLTLDPGKQPPEIQPKRTPDHPILARDRFSTWDWERSCATRRNATTKSLFKYMGIVGNRDDALRLWPPSETTAMPETSKTAMPKPTDVSPLVWAVVLTLDQIEKETPTGFGGLRTKAFGRKGQHGAVEGRLTKNSAKCLGRSSEANRGPLGNSEPPAGFESVHFCASPRIFALSRGGSRTWCGWARSKIDHAYRASHKACFVLGS